ncbi:MAG TPA: hypothetical protein VG722_12030 [Tepidisphaeraceae bacterium]|nr:hypothetical protein [Tepidisphaeraceae bacterium]
MATLPMYRQNVSAPHWRGIFLPGGHEFYEVRVGGTSMRIGIGNPYSQEYRRCYRRYRRWPTRFWPPLPAQFPFATFEQNGQRRTIDGRRAALEWDETPSIRLGPAEIQWLENKIRCRWSDEVTDFAMEADTSGPLSSHTTADGTTREIMPFNVNPKGEGTAAGQIMHEFGASYTAEAAAYYLQSNPTF